MPDDAGDRPGDEHGHEDHGGVEPRSLVFDLLGDYVRHHAGEIRLRALVGLAEELGVAGPTIRVVAARSS